LTFESRNRNELDMEAGFYRLVLGLLGVWRITHLLAAEDGPWDLMVRLRRAAGTGFWAKLLDCFECLSLWVAVPFAAMLGNSWVERGLFWLGFSAAAILLEKSTTRRRPGPTPVQYFEDEPKP
jgi:hypothetical protein